MDTPLLTQPDPVTTPEIGIDPPPLHTPPDPDPETGLDPPPLHTTPDTPPVEIEQTPHIEVPPHLDLEVHLQQELLVDPLNLEPLQDATHLHTGQEDSYQDAVRTITPPDNL